MSELTPKELIEKYKLDRIGWKPGDIGTLLKLELVTGTKINRKGFTFVDEDSLKFQLKRRDELLEQKKINIDALGETKH